MSFQIVNIDTPNAVHNTCVFSCFAADDSVTNFHVALDRFKEQIEHMHGMKWSSYIMYNIQLLYMTGNTQSRCSYVVTTSSCPKCTDCPEL